MSIDKQYRHLHPERFTDFQLSYDMRMAHIALHNAQANMIDVWRSKNHSFGGWTSKYLVSRYAFYRGSALTRVSRCKLAVARCELALSKARVARMEKVFA